MQKETPFGLKERLHFLHFVNHSVPSKLFFSSTTVKVPVCLFVSTRENVVML